MIQTNRASGFRTNGDFYFELSEVQTAQNRNLNHGYVVVIRIQGRQRRCFMGWDEPQLVTGNAQSWTAEEGPSKDVVNPTSMCVEYALKKSV